MREIVYSFTGESDRSVLDFLKREKGYSARIITKLRKSPGAILINGEHARTVDILTDGDELRIKLPDTPGDIKGVNLPLKVVYEDEDLLIADKPAGMAVHPTRRHQGDTLADAVAYYLGKKGIRTAFRAVNRLDRDTSGAVVIALNEYSACRLQGSLKKEYFAVVQGIVEGEGRIDAPIYRINERSIMRAVGEQGKRAVTNYKSLLCDADKTLLKCTLETGRTHQIRVHFSSISHPLVGDDMYGAEMSDLTRQALHCGKVEFVHPVSGEEMSVKCPPGEDICALFGKTPEEIQLLIYT